MAPKTLIKIGDMGDSFGVNLIDGYMLAKIDSKNKTNLKFSASQKQLNFSKGAKGTLIIEKDKNGISKISSLTGVLNLNIDGKEVKLDGNNILEINKDGKNELKKKDISLILPKRGKKVWTQGMQKIKFSWKDGEKYRTN